MVIDSSEALCYSLFMDTTNTGATSTTHQTFIAHYLQAAAWVRYNSRSERSVTEARILKVMRQLSVADLTRMLGERGIVP
jgi:hypothetical protein